MALDRPPRLDKLSTVGNRLRRKATSPIQRRRVPQNVPVNAWPSYEYLHFGRLSVIPQPIISANGGSRHINARTEHTMVSKYLIPSVINLPIRKLSPRHRRSGVEHSQPSISAKAKRSAFQHNQLRHSHHVSTVKRSQACYLVLGPRVNHSKQSVMLLEEHLKCN